MVVVVVVVVVVGGTGAGDVTSMTGSLVMVKTADPLVTWAPLTDWSPDPVTRYTVDPAVMAGERTVTVMGGKDPVSFTPCRYTPNPKVTTLI